VDNTLPSYDDVIAYEKEREASGLEPPTYEEALQMVGAPKPVNPSGSTGLARQDNPSLLLRLDSTGKTIDQFFFRNVRFHKVKNSNKIYIGNILSFFYFFKTLHIMYLGSRN
jgi:hypothetical protein